MNSASGIGYGLPDGYRPRWPVEYYVASSDRVRLQTWQADVYRAASDAMTILGSERLIDIGCGSGEKSMRYSGGNCIGIEYGDNVDECRQNFPTGDWRAFDLDESDDPPASASELGKSVVISSDVIEHLQFPERLLSMVSKCLKNAPLAIISTPDRALTSGAGHMGPPLNPAHAREWTATEMLELLRESGFVHGVLTWTRPEDLSNAATTTTVFLSNSAATLDQLGLIASPVHGLVLAPPRLPQKYSRIAAGSSSFRRQLRRAQLRAIGRRPL